MVEEIVKMTGLDVAYDDEAGEIEKAYVREELPT